MPEQFIQLDDILAEYLNWLETKGYLKKAATQDMLYGFLKETGRV